MKKRVKNVWKPKKGKNVLKCIKNVSKCINMLIKMIYSFVYCLLNERQ